MPDRYCAVPARRSAVKELRDRRKELEAELRGLDPEEGHEWPSDEDEREEVVSEST